MIIENISGHHTGALLEELWWSFEGMPYNFHFLILVFHSKSHTRDQTSTKGGLTLSITTASATICQFLLRSLCPSLFVHRQSSFPLTDAKDTDPECSWIHGKETAQRIR